MGFFKSIGKVVGGIGKSIKHAVKGIFSPETLLTAGLTFGTSMLFPPAAVGLDAAGLAAAGTAAEGSLITNYALKQAAKSVLLSAGSSMLQGSKADYAKKYSKLPTFQFGGETYIGRGSLDAHMREVDALEDSIDMAAKYKLDKERINLEKDKMSWEKSKYNDYIRALKEIIEQNKPSVTYDNEEGKYNSWYDEAVGKNQMSYAQ